MTSHAARSPSAARTSRSKKKTTRTPAQRRWSQKVTDSSDALKLEEGVFKSKSPKAIAGSLKRSAEASQDRKSPPYRSAMSMLTFYINRGGRGLPATVRRLLERAKTELRALFHRPAPAAKS